MPRVEWFRSRAEALVWRVHYNQVRPHSSRGYLTPFEFKRSTSVTMTSEMNPDEATDRVIFHSKPEAGAFLSMLRTYQGLRDDVLADVRESLRACAPRFSSEQLPRELLSAVWAISYFGRSWALEPDGMLCRNNLITDADQKRLAEFLGRFDHAVAMLLDGAPDEAFVDWRPDT